MTTEQDLMSRELRRIMEFLNLAASTVKDAKRKRPKPQAAIDVATHTDRAARSMRVSLDLVRQAGDEPDAAAWSALVMAAVSVGMAAGTALEYERRAAGNGNRRATERMRKLDELAARPETAYRIGQTAEIVGMEPESVAQAVRRRRMR